MPTLTTALVRDAKPRAKMYELTCSGLPGFLLRILPTGKKVLLVRHKVGDRDHRTRLGLWGPDLTVEEARRRAAVLLGGGELALPVSALDSQEEAQPRARSGTRLQRPRGPRPVSEQQPVVEAVGTPRMASKRSSTAAARLANDTDLSRSRPTHAADGPAVSIRTAAANSATFAPHIGPATSASTINRVPTVRELVERFHREYINIYLKPRTAINYRHYLDQYILPRLGDLPFTQVSRSAVQALHASLRERPAAGDYVLCVLGSLYTRIIQDWELADIRNPVSNTKRFGSRRVERFLTPDERHDLEAVLQRGVRLPVARPGHVDPMSAWAIRLLAYTGLRKDEILSLKWPMVDWQHAVFNLPDTKTGQRSVPVSSQVMSLLRDIQAHCGSPRTGYVIRSRTGSRLLSLNTTWERIRVLAGIPDVRIHDLRHSFASDALMGGVPLAVIGKILGHRQPTTTQRYAHLSDRVVRDAVENTSSRIADAAPPPSTIAPTSTFKPLTNSQWAKVAPLLLAGRPPRSHYSIRKILDGVRWVLHHNASWQKVPPEHGTSTTCWRWYKRWRDDGIWANVAKIVLE